MKGSIFSKKLRTHPAKKNETETKVPQAGSGNKIVKKSVGTGFPMAAVKSNPQSQELTKKSIRLSQPSGKG